MTNEQFTNTLRNLSPEDNIYVMTEDGVRYDITAAVKDDKWGGIKIVTSKSPSQDFPKEVTDQPRINYERDRNEQNRQLTDEEIKSRDSKSHFGDVTDWNPESEKNKSKSKKGH